MISTLPREIGSGDSSVIYSCIKTINDYLERYSELIYAKVIAAQVDPLIAGQPKIDLEYNKFCPNSFFGGFTTWNDVPDAIKVRMCEYLETVFPLLQVAYDNWASKIFFSKAFGRKGRNPSRTLSIKKWQSKSNDGDFIQACHDDDASICEDISSNIDSEEISALYGEEGDTSLYFEVPDEVVLSKRNSACYESEEVSYDNVPNSNKLQKNKCPPRRRTQSAKAHVL
ncbi:hypothetical protein V1507DRAFT_469635 [Lipomyces tetrasporus]